MKFRFCLLFLLIFLCLNRYSSGQLIVNNGSTPQQLVQNVLLGTGVTVSNVSFTGTPLAIGTFNGAAANIGLSSGVLMTTGLTSVAPGPNTLDGAGNDNNLPGDSLLGVLSGDATFDASILEFDFTPLADTVRFRYVFASEEYNEYVCASVNDVFGFFISGPGITGEQNIAIIPGTSTPVSINTLNNGSVGSNGNMGPGCILSHSGYFVNNASGSSVQYDGFTTVLTAQTVVIPCLTYHIRLAIADGGDHVFDSGVFLEAGSFISGNPIVAVAQATSGTLGCAPFIATFSNTSTGTNHFYWDFNDGSPLDTSSNPAHTFMNGGIYNVRLIADDTTACNFSDTAYFVIFIDSGIVHSSFNLVQNGFCDSLRALVTATGSGAHIYEWNFGDGTLATGLTSAHTYTTPGIYDIFHIETDTICNIRDSVFNRVVLLPKLQSSISANSLEGCSPLDLTMCYPGAVTGNSTFRWDFGNGSFSTALCDSAHYENPGDYHARLIVTDTTYCNRRDTSFITVHVKVKPEAEFNFPDSQNVLFPVTFDNISRNALSYYWNFDDGLDSYQENPEHQFIAPGTYTIRMISYNDVCVDSVSHVLKIYENPQAIWFPKAFTPNGDGKNDFFTADGIGIISFHMIIFNRWGEKVFESDAIKDQWDGHFNGSPAENGVYVFHIQATLLNKDEVEKYGTVTVFK